MNKNWVCIKNNFYFLSKAFRVAPAFMILSALLRVVMGVRVTFMNMYFLAFIVSAVTEGKSLASLLWFLGLSFLIVSMSYLLEAAYTHVWKPLYTEKIAAALQRVIFDKSRASDLSRFDSESYYSSVILAGNESGDRVVSVVDNFMNLIEILVAILTIIGYSFTLDWIVPVVTVLPFLISFYLNRHIARRRVAYDTELKAVDKKLAMLRRILFVPQYAKDIRLTQISETLMKRYREAVREKENIVRKKGGHICRLSAWETIFSAGICMDFLVPLLLSIRMLVLKNMAISQFVAVINGCNQLSFKLSDLSRELGLFFQNGEFISRYRTVEDMSSVIETTESTPEAAPDFRHLRLEQVSFSYDNQAACLKDICLQIHKGEKIAIVGRNGSGKTTLIKLLLRLYDGQAGEIYLNDQNIKDHKVQTYRACYAALFQDFQIYAAPLSNNVAMDTAIQESRVKNSVAAVGLSKAMANIHGLLTRELEDTGISFSGGQLQRMALARALYRDSEILVMDEPTSAMDVRFEKKFYELIYENLSDKTILFVSHRLATVLSCDRIIYMEKGRVAGDGTHQALMQSCEGYARLYRAQAELYQEDGIK